MEAENNSAEQFARYREKLDYADFFTDSVAKGYVSSMNQLFFSVPAESKMQILSHMSSLVVVYSLIVYKLYGVNPELQRQIDSSKELGANFKAIREFLDANGGEKIADSYIEKIDEYIS